MFGGRGAGMDYPRDVMMYGGLGSFGRLRLAAC